MADIGWSMSRDKKFTDKRGQVDLKPGTKCLAMFTGEDMWCRGQIMDLQGDKIKVRESCVKLVQSFRSKSSIEMETFNQKS